MSKRENWWNEDKTDRGNASGLFASTELTPRAQRYMIRVYRNLALTVGSAAIASLLHSRGIVEGLGGLGTILSVGLFYVIALSRGRLNEQIRLGLLLAFGFLQGLDIGPLLRTFVYFDPDLITSAVVGTLIAFVSFSGAALFSRRGSFLYLGGLLSFASIMLLVTGFFPSLFDFNIYLGLFIFCFYIIYDTQTIVERAERGVLRDTEGVDGSLQLFTDLFGIFVRLLILLSKSSSKKSERRNKKRSE